MKKLLLAGAALVLMATSALSTQPVVVPAQYRGLWCFNKKVTYLYRCRQANDESYQNIGRNRMKVDEENSCPIIAVKPTAKGHRLSWKCPPNVEAYVPPPGSVDLWLDARGRLHM
jgi:hypothetical protein